MKKKENHLSKKIAYYNLKIFFRSMKLLLFFFFVVVDYCWGYFKRTTSIRTHFFGYFLCLWGDVVQNYYVHV